MFANKISFSPERAGKILLSILPKRTKDVIERRFGLAGFDKKETLESIGRDYKITRERVRQIENYGLNLIRRSDAFKKNGELFQELKSTIASRGGIVEEASFLDELAKNSKDKNYLAFLMELGGSFVRFKEDGEFNHRWTLDKERADRVHDALRDLRKDITNEEVFPQEAIVGRLAKHAEKFLNEKFEPQVLISWLNLSHRLAQNSLGQWGLISCPQIRPRGVRDLAYLVMERHGSPMHFREVADTIEKTIGKRAYVHTVHNELIKDQRFVLVGRGLYALCQWGYREGRVIDIIKSILEASGPMPKDELIKCVLKERHIKESTILINLQNKKYFQKLPDGRYILRSAPEGSRVFKSKVA